MQNYKTHTIIMWCPKCGAKEELKIFTKVNRPSTVTTEVAIDYSTLNISIGCRSNCLCGTRMIDMDVKFVETCEKLRTLGVKVLEVNKAFYTPNYITNNSSITQFDTYCSGANITISFEPNWHFYHTTNFVLTCSESEEFNLERIQEENNDDLGGITISSAFYHPLSYNSRFGFLNKEDIGGDEKLDYNCKISDDRLLRFLKHFIENIEERGI